MYFSQPEDSEVIAAVLARILNRVLHRGTVRSVQNLCDWYLGRESTVSIFQEDANVTAHVIAQTGNRIMWGHCGVVSSLKAAQLVNAYGYPDLADSDQGVNRRIANTVTFMSRYIRQMMNQTGPYEVTLYGHSYGGAVAQVIPLLLRAWNPDVQIKVVTFGSPRFATVGFCPLDGPAWGVHRFMNNGDPVPYLPPHYDEDAAGYAVYSLVLGANLNRWTHVGNGTVMNNNLDRYDARSALLPDIGSIPPGVSIMGWATQMLVDPTTEHGISTYDARLAEWFPEAANAPPPPPHAPAADPIRRSTPPDPGPYLVQGIQRSMPSAVEDAIALNGARPPSKPFYAAKSNGIWFVWHLADPIVQCKGAREARRTAARYNALVAQWSLSPVGDQDALLSAIDMEFPPE